MSTVPAIRHTRLAAPVGPGLLLRFHALLRGFAVCACRWRQRRDLSELDDHLLGDIGITREQARREASRPFWH